MRAIFLYKNGALRDSKVKEYKHVYREGVINNLSYKYNIDLEATLDPHFKVYEIKFLGYRLREDLVIYEEM